MEQRIFGFDIGTTSIGFAVVDHDSQDGTGTIRDLGVRIFPEARDKDDTPFNQHRRQQRMMRRQLRRRRDRRRRLNTLLSEAGMLPDFGSIEWHKLMNSDPYDLRRRGLREDLTLCQFGRSLYHLAQRRHFRGRELEEEDNDKKTKGRDTSQSASAESSRATSALLERDGKTLGEWLAELDATQRKRGIHANRKDIVNEFDQLWREQEKHHREILTEDLKQKIKQEIFFQRPVFWRKNTLEQCRYKPEDPLCPKGSWLAYQFHMIDKVNNLTIRDGGHFRCLDSEERNTILTSLQAQVSMTWGGARKALKSLYRLRGQEGIERQMKFNLELGGDKRLPGNPLEARLAKIFGTKWTKHTQKAAIRESIHQNLWPTDYSEIGDQRVIILPENQRKLNRKRVSLRFIQEFGITNNEADALSRITLPTGWEKYSVAAIREFMPHLEAGVRLGDLTNSPAWEEWRDQVFPSRNEPTGELLDRLPSPANRDENSLIRAIRNPTVVRTRNELRKVVNNLIEIHGKPDLIRVEIARDVGMSKRDREQYKAHIRLREKARADAKKDLNENGLIDPDRSTVDKWLLWKECGHCCPYTGDPISFENLFRNSQFEVEHIWPRCRSLDDSFGNKTLCRKDVNIEKGDRTPFEYLGHTDGWQRIVHRVTTLGDIKGPWRMSKSKVRRFLDQKMPDEFAHRQLNDTSFAAREAIKSLKRLWPDVGPHASVTVQAVSGRVTAQLRKVWKLNNVLSSSTKKTRDDHRHHAIDALVVACTRTGITQRLSRYWRERDFEAIQPEFPPPWASIRNDLTLTIPKVIVSHRVRKKVSGALHKETIYGDTGIDFTTRFGTYRQFVTRKKVENLTIKVLNADPTKEGEGIRDRGTREVLRKWVDEHGGNPKKAFPPYPRLGKNGPEIRSVRVLMKQAPNLMATVSTGSADLGANHHIAIFEQSSGRIDFEVTSLFEAARRLSRHLNIVNRRREDGAKFLISLAQGEALQIPDGESHSIWIVTSIWSNGQIVLEEANDASGKTTMRPNPERLIRRGAKKIAIDPIGRIRKAND